jgi:hypothetical protein
MNEEDPMIGKEWRGRRGREGEEENINKYM